MRSTVISIAIGVVLLILIGAFVSFSGEGAFMVFRPFILLMRYGGWICIAGLISAGSLYGLCRLSRSSLTTILPIGVIGVAVGAWIGYAAKGGNTLYWGGQRGFWADTIASLVTGNKISYEGFDLWIIVATLMVILGVLGGTVCLFFAREDRVRYYMISTVTVIFWTAAVLEVFQSIFLRVPYLMERTAVLFWPVIVIMGCCTLEVLGQWRLQRTAKVLSLFVAIAAVVVFSVQANLRNTKTWPFTRDARDMVQTVQTLTCDGERSKVRVGVSWLLYPCMKFYLIDANPISNCELVCINDVTSRLNIDTNKTVDCTALCLIEVEAKRAQPFGWTKIIKAYPDSSCFIIGHESFRHAGGP
jgi:hypothetical protein